MKIILACLINMIALSAFAQSQPVPSGVFQWNELPVTKGDHRESRKLTVDLYIMESGKMHGITNVADKPCSYFAFKWR